MTIIGATGKAAQHSPGDLRRDSERRDEPASQSRALVPLTRPAEREPTAGFRQTFFLAQLIANKEQLPQTRERRRGDPGEAIAAYRAADALVHH